MFIFIWGDYTFDFFVFLLNKILTNVFIFNKTFLTFRLFLFCSFGHGISKLFNETFLTFRFILCKKYFIFFLGTDLLSSNKIRFTEDSFGIFSRIYSFFLQF